MPHQLLLLLLILSPLLVWLGYREFHRHSNLRRSRRHQRLAAQAFPADWHQLLQDQVPLYRSLPEDLQRKLQGHINIFLDHKVFVGCDGFEITDKVRLLIAAQACLLTLNLDNHFYPGFESILVYPSTYEAPTTHVDGYLHTDMMDLRAGESWERGPLVLAWDEVWHGSLTAGDGYNVVLHEFAHKLDEENSRGPGLPRLHDPSQYADWARVLGREYEQLCQHGSDVIDNYGATSPEEFFAVASEAFFEMPLALHHHHPELYEQLQRFYRLDPLSWCGEEK